MESAVATSQLAELLAASARPGAALRLDRACLLVSAAIDPATDIAACESALDALAQRAVSAAASSADRYALPGALLNTLFAGDGFRGDADSYGDSGNSLLSRVIVRKVGIPITLSIVLMETARRAGLALEGVGLPGHFVVRFPDPTSRLFIDPFNSGAVLDERDCRAIVERIYGPTLAWRDDFLDAVAPRAILKRVVLNLKNALTGEKDYVTALNAIQIQLLIDPDDPAELRDRGIILARLHRYESAICDLEAYLDRLPDAGDGEHIRNTVRYLRRASE